MERYDVAIVGGGQAGIPLAQSLAKAGRKVALIERKWLGGSCVNFGCTPTKAALASARIAHMARRGAEYGLRIPAVEVDFPAVLERARSVAAGSRHELESSLQSSSNPQWLCGHGRILGRDGDGFRLAAGEEQLLAGDVVLDTGTRSALPPIEGLEQIDCLHSENWLEREKLPERLAIVGGGYIGLEMAQLYRRLGSEVTVIEHSGQIASQEDEEVAAALQAALEREGIRFLLNAKADRFRNTTQGIEVRIASDGSRTTIGASDVFVALGRKPNVEDLGLETIGLAPSEHGTIEVDGHLRTPVRGLWAAGDIRGGPMFTHTSWDDYRIIESQLAGDGSRSLHRIVPYAIFTDPQLGRAGLSERDARKAGKAIKVGRFNVADNSKARELGETGGFIKVIADAQSGKLLGAAVLAAEASELVHLYVELMNAGADYGVMTRAIHIHPTLAEAAQSATAAIS